MNEQLELLQFIYDEFSPFQNDFDYLEYIYKFNPDEGWVGSELFASENDIPKIIVLTKDSENRIKELCNKLHIKMKAHTGGDWRKFIFIIENRKVRTKFIYEPQSCMDLFEDIQWN